MQSVICRLLYISLFLLSFSCLASDYANYDVHTDESGNIYLKAPDRLVVLPQSKAIPIQISPPNGLLRLYEVKGIWYVEVLTQAEWDALNLTPGNDIVEEIRYDDFDGSGTAKLFLALRHRTTSQLLISGLTGIPTVDASYFEPTELAGTAQDTPVFSTFATMASPSINALAVGEFRVDESGSSTYNMPLSLPAGIAGVVPQLAFSYNSSGGDGYMGSGWSFAGGSAITRCPKNLSVDTAQGNVSFTAADRLCLDGQRLVRNGAANDKNVTDATYWTSTTQFHTELDNLSLIRQHGTAIQGPKGFTVETKSGEIHYYGDISAITGNDTMGKPLALDARSIGNVSENGADAFFDSHAGSNIARLWALKAIKDVKGNYIVFKYHEDQALGEHYLTEVHYTGRAGGAAPFARVVLNYVENTKIAVGWQAQKRVAMTKLLDTVNIELDGAIYRQYRLNYFNTNVLEEKNYLLSIQECADTGSANCLPATNFEWNQPPALNTSYVTRCDNEPGVPQYCWQEPVTENYMPFTTTFQLKGTSVERNFHQLIDINGDGFVDLVYPRLGSWRVRLGGTTSNWTQNCFTPSGEPTQCIEQPAVSNFATETTMSAVGVNKKEYLQTIDYNGDGQRDLLVANSATSNWIILSFVPSSTTITQCEPFPDNQICYPIEVTSNYTSIDTGFKATGLEGGALVADYDGDGLEDIVFISNGMFQAYRNRGMSSTNIHLGFEHQTNLGITADEVPQFGVLIASNTADLKSTSAVDVNGDGRTDILLKVTDGYCSVGGFDSYECGLGGYQWISYSGWRLYTSTGLGYNETQILGDYTNLRAVDLNGDGYTDIVFQIGTTWYYSLSNGDTFLPPRNSNLTSATNLIGYTYFLDINGDGRTDILLPTSTSNWRVMLSRPTKTHEQVIFEQRGTRSFDSGATIQFADVNADGKLDLLTSTNDSGWKIFLSNRPYTKDHVIRKITNGFGVTTLIEYQAISDKDVYFRQNTPNNVDSDYFSPRAGMYVVSKVSSEVNSGKYVSVNYKYGGLLLHKKGRGLLGFEVLRTTDNQTGVVTETIYKQLFPYTGMPFKTTQSKDGVLMSYAENTLANRTTAYGGILPYISSSTEYNYQYGSDNTQYPLAKTVSSFVYDNYGNLTSSTVTQSDINDAAKKLVTSTSNVFNSSTVYQRYGRLTSATVTKTLDGNSSSALTRQSSFTYNADLMLDTETLSPNSASTKIATRHLYDAAGNISSKQVTAATTATGTSNVTRTSSTTYDTRFRYPASTTDAAGNTTSFTYNGISANSVTGRINYIDSVNANNQSSREYFDIIGRNYRSYVKGAQTADNAINSYTYWELCSAVGCPSGITGAYLRVRAERDGAPTQYQYLDKYGREVGAAAVLLDGNLSVSRTQYDDQGRPWRVYEPGSGNPSSLYNQSNYDILGRITGASLANGGSTSITYQGLTTLNVDAQGKQSKTTANYLGQTLSTEDHLGSKLTFSYDVYGNLKTAVASSGSLTSTRSTNDYNTYGHKIQMVDQDKGSWTYTYNGFGELLTQTDAKAQVTSFMYDSAGRLVRRYDPSGTTCWEFGTSAASYNKGLLYRVSSYSGSVDCSTTATPLYRETYTYNSRGFVSNKLVHTAGHSFSLSTTYDSAGRPDTFNYPSWSLNPSTDDVVVKYGYQNGHMKQLSNAKNTTEVYQQITAVTARGQVAQLSFRNGMQESRTYDAATGWLDTLTLSRNNLTQQFMDYDYDTVGNVTHRKHHFGLGSNAGFSEVFDYDDLHRVTSRTIGNYNNSSGYAALPAGFKLPETYTYDVWGNIKSKTGIGHYCYDSSKTNRLTAVWSGASCTGTQQYTLGYDNNGNVSSDGKHTFTYTAFDKPSRISKGSNYTDFAYGPDRQLYRRTDVRNSQTTDSFYIDGLYERVTLPSGVIEHKFYVGNAVITKRSNNAHDELYLHKDNQGSTISISNSAGTVLQQFIYDPWGRQYSVSTNSLFTTYSNPGTSKGYTGHNMVNDFEVIHMGGRTYNPHLGRFMQADPFVQAPGNLQNYNRYSYVLNNPMSYTDPSGYFFKKLFKAISDIPILNAVVTIALAVYCQACLVAYNALSTYAVTGSLRSGLIAGFTTAIMPGGGSVGRVFASAVIGGASTSLQGGKFGHGFFSAGLGAATGGFTKGISNNTAKIFVSAVIGGTVSKVTGGKFTNGAFGAAFAAAVTSDWSEKPVDQKTAQYAEMSGKVYSAERTDIDKLQVGDYTLRDIHADDTGLKAALFIDGNGNQVLAFAGTDFTSWADWKANILQGMGLKSSQYTNAIALAESYGPITYTGHSLGGGLASAAAIYTGGSGVVFNAAGLHNNTIGNFSRNRGNITHYHSGYDAVSVVNAVTLTKVPGSQINLGHASWHDMGSMCKVLRTSC